MLRLTDFRYPMTGVYTCHGLSPAGNASASIRLHIQSAVWKVYISSLFVSFATVALSIVVASAFGEEDEEEEGEEEEAEEKVGGRKEVED